MAEDENKDFYNPALETYRSALGTALREGKGEITSTKAQILIRLRDNLGISEDLHNKIMEELLAEFENPNLITYRSAIEQALMDDRLTSDEEAILALLRESMNISIEDHEKIVAEVKLKIELKKKQKAEAELKAEGIHGKTNEDDPFYWIQKGELIWASSGGKISEALKALSYFDKAIDLDSQNYLAWANKGLVLKTLEKIEEALVCYNRALRINPEYVTVWYNKGVLLGSIGNFDEAIIALTKVLELNPNHEFAKRDLGILKTIINKDKKKIEEPETAVDQS